MIVEVTQEHINRGIVKDCNNCPVALAMQENGFENVRVDGRHILYDHQPNPLELHFAVINNNFLRKWIHDFDGGEEVFPIQIDINEKTLYAKLVE